MATATPQPPGNTSSDRRPMPATGRAAHAGRLGALLWVALALTLQACSKPELEIEQPAPASAAQPAPTRPADAQGAARHELFTAGLEHAVSAVEDLALRARALLDTPTAATLTDARAAWMEARDRLEYLNVALGLADDQAPELAVLGQWRAYLLAWPIEPGAIDHFGAYTFSGLVFDIQVPLTLESVRATHQQMADSEAVLGLYPVRYLLFGDGQHDVVADLTLVDSLSEAHLEAGFTALEEAPNNRRRRLLALQVTTLRQDMGGLGDSWRSAPVAHAVASLTARQWRSVLVAELADTITELARLDIGDDAGYALDVFAQLTERTAARAPALKDLLPYLDLADPGPAEAALEPLLDPASASLAAMQTPSASAGQAQLADAAQARAQAFYRHLMALAAALRDPALR